MRRVPGNFSGLVGEIRTLITGPIRPSIPGSQICTQTDWQHPGAQAAELPRPALERQLRTPTLPPSGAGLGVGAGQLVSDASWPGRDRCRRSRWRRRAGRRPCSWVVTRVPAILLASHYAGLAFRARLPRISGSLTIGVLAGQHVLGLSRNSSPRNSPWWTTCASPSSASPPARAARRRHRRTRDPLVMTACITSFTWVFVFLAFLAVGRQLTFLADLSSAHVIAVLPSSPPSASRDPPPAPSPSSRRRRGTFCSHRHHGRQRRPRHRPLRRQPRAHRPERLAIPSTHDHRHRGRRRRRRRRRLRAGRPLGRRACRRRVRATRAGVASSFAAGAVSGVWMSQLLRPPRSRPALSRVLRPGYVLAFSGCLFVAGRRVGLEPLLLCVVAGATAANRRYAAAESERETLSAVVGALMPGVNLAFFTLAGASLRLSSAWRSSFAAWAVVGARLFALYHAARRVRPRGRAGCTRGGGVDGVRHAGGGGVGAGGAAARGSRSGGRFRSGRGGGGGVESGHRAAAVPARHTGGGESEGGAARGGRGVEV